METRTFANSHHQQLAMTRELNEPRIRRRSLAIALFALQLLTAVIAWIVAWHNVESIIVTGPLLALLGLALAVAVRPLCAWAPLLFALSAPAVAAVGAFVIAIFHLGPDAAYAPIVILLGTYIFLIIAAAPAVFGKLQRWSSTVSMVKTRAWQFSLKSLLVAMTVIALSTALLTAIMRSLADFPIAFGAFGSIAITIACLVAWRFYSYRKRVIFRPQSSGSLPWDEWLEKKLFAVFFSAKHDVRCSLCGRTHSDARPFTEGRNG